MTDFEKWWHETGSGIAPMHFQDHEEHAKRVAKRAWDAASDPIDRMLLDEFLLRSNAAEANARIRQLLGVSEQLRAERDDARKQICESHSRNCHQAYQHAIECNWDCYKETS